MSGPRIPAAIADPDEGLRRAAQALARLPDPRFGAVTLATLGASWSLVYELVRNGTVTDYDQDCPCVICEVVRAVKAADPRWVMEAEALRDADPEVRS